jgi:LytS/YehU family sensor histidine kinase
VGILLISICQASLIIGVNILFGGAWNTTAIAGLWWGMILATGVWTILYIRLVERRFSTTRENNLQLALREAQLHALEFQMSPHFLFNCLNSIRALVAVDPERAQDMLTRLANVLRNRLRHDPQHTVALGAEIDVTTDYLALEGIRFHDRLRQEIMVDSKAASCEIPPLLLQTLVENAIKHGISKFSGRGDLIVRANLEDRQLKIEVENTGRLTQGDASGEAGVGLANARERLRLLYGDRASLQLTEDQRNDRVRATVLIPAL